MTTVIDAAALMALILDEAGADIVAGVIRGSRMSTVNVSECGARAVERGASAEDILKIIRGFDIVIRPFDLPQAVEAARLWEPTRHAGASLGDRACLALASTSGGVIYTADRRMASLVSRLDIDIRLIR